MTSLLQEALAKFICLFVNNDTHKRASSGSIRICQMTRNARNGQVNIVKQIEQTDQMTNNLMKYLNHLWICGMAFQSDSKIYKPKSMTRTLKA